MTDLPKTFNPVTMLPPGNAWDYPAIHDDYVQQLRAFSQERTMRFVETIPVDWSEQWEVWALPGLQCAIARVTTTVFFNDGSAKSFVTMSTSVKVQ